MAAWDPDDMPSWLSDLTSKDSEIIAGVADDDCAVVSCADNSLVIATTDYLNANPIAKQLGIGTPADLGRLVVANNLSDLLGSGAKPRILLLSVMMERGSKEGDYKQLMRGANSEARRWGVHIAGGDTKIGAATSICATAIGFAASEQNLFLRNKAEPGDLIWVSGALGSCAAATVILADGSPHEKLKKWAETAILSPELPYKKSRKVSNAYLGKGGVDISDGLGAALKSIADSSKVGISVDSTKIPVLPEVKEIARRLHLQAWAFAFASGGDCQFIISCEQEATKRLRRIGLVQVGTVTEKLDLSLQLPSGSAVPLPTKGHRDARNLPFASEIRQLAEQASNS